MVKKKGKTKGKSKKKGKSSPSPDLKGDANAEVLADSPSPKKKGKRPVKKKKLTKAEAALERLNNLVEEYKKDRAKYDRLVNRIDKWFTENQKKILDLFHRFDTSNVGYLTYDQFKAGMMDVDIPCNMIELHLLTTLLDLDGDQTIDYSEFTQGVRYFRQVEADATATEKEELIDPVQLIGPWEPKYAKIQFKFLTFESREDHPAHFDEVLPLNLQVEAVCSVIRKRTKLLSHHVSLYRDKVEPMIKMDSLKTLREYEIRGGSHFDPKEVELYYDYEILDEMDCPILMCDHYFSKPKPV